ncbi:MAG: MogA/MoaB family molybdenum cofactor biosynthesis protein [Candidatus Omnitrophica bacterium]|nr:MogA/MoaB family molybdenum cofactor biosynthesis protein [Candidatus Omnitrophota bacterium]MDD5137861.1 MogA/MoaB family molybdenum cofactor biosynthesis protein [Candidatus Omnitrophota bacterium]
MMGHEMAKDATWTGCRVAVVTVSDSCASGSKQDKSGPVLKGLLEALGADIVSCEIVADDSSKIAGLLKGYADASKADVVFTAGGTGLGPRDVTPEATRSVLDKEAPGLAEWIRAKGAAKTARAVLSRGVCGLRGRTLIINLPGSPKGAAESFEAVADLVPHALAMARGEGHA